MNPYIQRSEEELWQEAEYVPIQPEPQMSDYVDDGPGVVGCVAGALLWLAVTVLAAWLHHVASLAVHP